MEKFKQEINKYSEMHQVLSRLDNYGHLAPLLDLLTQMFSAERERFISQNPMFSQSNLNWASDLAKNSDQFQSSHLIPSSREFREELKVFKANLKVIVSQLIDNVGRNYKMYQK